jgi:hypothetical protein
MIGKGFPVTLLNERAYAFKNPIAMSIVDIRFWLSRRPGLNVGLFLPGSGLAVVDTDSDDAVAEAERRGLLSSLLIRTRRGLHAVFRHRLAAPTNMPRFLPMTDVLFNSAIPIPPATLDGFERTFVTPVPPASRLELLPPWVRPMPKPSPVITPLASQTRESLVRWINKVDAVSGNRGHSAALRVSLRIAREVEDMREGLAIFLAWNAEHAFPPFSEKEAMHKVREGYRLRNQS